MKMSKVKGGNQTAQKFPKQLSRRKDSRLEATARRFRPILLTDDVPPEAPVKHETLQKTLSKTISNINLGLSSFLTTKDRKKKAKKIKQKKQKHQNAVKNVTNVPATAVPLKRSESFRLKRWNAEHDVKVINSVKVPTGTSANVGRPESYEEFRHSMPLSKLKVPDLPPRPKNLKVPELPPRTVLYRQISSDSENSVADEYPTLRSGTDSEQWGRVRDRSDSIDFNELRRTKSRDWSKVSIDGTLSQELEKIVLKTPVPIPDVVERKKSDASVNSFRSFGVLSRLSSMDSLSSTENNFISTLFEKHKLKMDRLFEKRFKCLGMCSTTVADCSTLCYSCQVKKEYEHEFIDVIVEQVASKIVACVWIDSTPVNRRNRSVFDSDKSFPLSVHDYLFRLVTYTEKWLLDKSEGCELHNHAGIRCLFVAVYYLFKLQIQAQEDGQLLTFTQHNIYNLLAGCFLLAIKYTEDEEMSNEWWSKVGEIDLKKLNMIESEICNLTKFGLFVNETQIAQMYHTFFPATTMNI